MVVFSFYIFDRHAECVYKKKWLPPSLKAPDLLNGAPQPRALSAEDDAKLVFGTIFSLRNMVRKLGGVEDKYVAHLLQKQMERYGLERAASHRSLEDLEI
ncbi:TRAPP subunit bet5 [Xylographa soralifera]|nr:TRAPP subunit bet5 [Xylographa soralifera]